MSLFLLLALAAAPAAVSGSPAISAERIKADVLQLSSDDFAGRGPGEAGESKTIAYLADRFAAAGLQPGGENGGWYQDVPLVRMDRLPGATMALTVTGRTIPLTLGRDATLSLRNAGATALAGAELVFAGYGIVDPARGWDAYAGIDMKGKIAVVLANDPDFEAGADLGFEGRRMAYSGRVGVKFEAADKAGAAGVLVIHEEAAASYPFAQVGSGDALPAMGYAPLAPSAMKLTGWLSRDRSLSLLRDLGLDLARLKQEARQPAFRARPLAGASLAARGEIKATPFTSRNVIARLTGAERPDEIVLYGAHWDANGRNGADRSGDTIRNGAIDNATGTAELLEVARAFAAGKRPARTVVFAAWTAEEKGLLGANFYAAHPLAPLARTVAVINLDPHLVLPAARNIELVGGGRTPLEADLARVAKSQGLRTDPEPNPEAGWYFRSDHFPFARRGVPALSFRAGRDLVEGGREAGDAIVSAYNARCYHQPCDEFSAAWTFAGTAQEAQVAFALGSELADSAAWPTWNEGNEFKPLRDAMSPTVR
ncbi:peptidase M28 [Sphingomonas deserti]|uniref:Peptidase M28 n=2 Tax=Allosphingosinicella deserti TaxID=2116704 RepID=A0A2P7R094_9SPHN|nr:peptidase M28 [Sphingomonas deserti]